MGHRSTVEAIVQKNIVTVSPQEPVAVAAQRMKQCNVGSLLVVDPQGRPCGIVTERDLVSRCLADAADPANLCVADVMSTDLAACNASASVNEANAAMIERRVRHMPVFDGPVCVGMISSRDIMSHHLRTSAAMRQSAEQTARFIKRLKSLELEFVMGEIEREVPPLFEAAGWMIHVGPQAGLPGGRTHRHQCDATFRDGAMLCECGGDARDDRSAGPGGRCVRLTLPYPRIDGDDAPCVGMLCMCGIPCEAGLEDVLEYKTSLLQEILTAAVQNSLLYEDARRHSRQDALTGLKTRLVLESRMDEEISRGQRHDRPLCLAVIDIDRFKSVNDDCGHAVGDALLRELAALLLACTRASDMCARYGGDEFVVLMPETDLDEAHACLERLRETVQQSLVTPVGRAITLSCGVAQWDCGAGENSHDLFRRADAALYRAKRAGRNRVAISCSQLQTSDLEAPG